jgi:hypothetical protein
MKTTRKELARFQGIALQIFLVTAFLCLGFLLEGNMGKENEVNILPFARQHADPTWLAGDWYYNQPAGYRIPFIAIFGNMAAAWGFLTTSIVGRFLCYSLIASGFVHLGRKLGMSLLPLLLAVGLFLYIDLEPGLVAREWMVGGLEPKAVAYGLLLWAIGFMLEGRYRFMALFLGLSVTFHTLVGGWAFLVIVGWLLLRRRQDFTHLPYFGSVALIYLAASALAIRPILAELSTPTPPGPIHPSYLYVFIRTPHHLNPLSWEPGWWLEPVIYLLFLAVGVGLLQRQLPADDKAAKQQKARLGLAEFTLATLVPFAIGLAIAPFDSQGKFLQYYPFRLGDIMLPLGTCFVFVCALEQSFTGKVARRGFSWFCILLIAVACSIQTVEFREQVLALRDFPTEAQRVDPEWKTMATWIRNNTPWEATVVSPPVELVNFTWLTERPTIAKYKLVPPTSAGVLEWHTRLSDLSGDVNPWPDVEQKDAQKQMIRYLLTKGFYELRTEQTQALMDKYQASYFLTRIGHSLQLPVAHQNSRYVLYENPVAGL